MRIWLVCFVLLIGCGGTKTLDPNPIIVEASALARVYESNELAGDAEFKGKTLRINGVVREVSKDILGNPFVILEGTKNSYMGVQCSFAESAATLLSRLRKGETTSFDCRVTGKLLHVQTSDCAINLVP